MKEIVLHSSGYSISVMLTNQQGSISGTILSDMHSEDDSEELSAALNAVESLILAQACAGINIQSVEYMQSLTTTIETIYNQYDC